MFFFLSLHLEAVSLSKCFMFVKNLPPNKIQKLAKLK